jgi:hypothetical protein
MKTASHEAHRSIDRLDRIAVTTLLLHAEDDPVVASSHVDWTKVESNKYILVGHTKRGGHCAWYQGLTPFGETWGDDASLSFVSAVIEQTSQTHFFVDIVRQTIGRLQISGGAFAGTNITPRAMARICSASDLQQAFPFRR